MRGHQANSAKRGVLQGQVLQALSVCVRGEGGLADFRGGGRLLDISLLGSQDCNHQQSATEATAVPVLLAEEVCHNGREMRSQMSCVGVKAMSSLTWLPTHATSLSSFPYAD